MDEKGKTTQESGWESGAIRILTTPSVTSSSQLSHLAFYAIHKERDACSRLGFLLYS